MRVLLDSVILIDHLNGIQSAGEYLRQVQTRAAISLVTRAEVLAGVRGETELQLTNQLLSHFINLPFEMADADEAARLRRDLRLRLPDAFQAALARRNHLWLATRNTRDFDPSRFDFVVVPYTL